MIRNFKKSFKMNSSWFPTIQSSEFPTIFEELKRFPMWVTYVGNRGHIKGDSDVQA